MFLLPLSFYFRCACAPNATFQIVDEGEDRQNHFSAFSREYGEKKKLDKPNSWAISQFFLVLFPSFLTSKKAAEPTELKKSKHKTTKKTGRNIFFVKKLTNKFNNMSSRPHSPRSRSPDSRPSSRAFVRQCIFYEKYGGCKFGKDCFYAHNDEMTLGVRNAMQMAQQMGKGGIGGGGVEIRFDERENEVKMVRVVETFPAGNERERGDRGGMADRNGFGRGPGYGGMGGGRGRFMGRGRGNFRGGPIRGRGRGGRYISPIRGSGNIFAESPDERDHRRKRKDHKMDRRSRSTSPRRKHSRRSKSASSSLERKYKRKGKRGVGRSSSSSGSNSRSNSPSPNRKRSNSPKEMRKRRKRSTESPPDPSRMELRSLAKRKEDDGDEDKKQKQRNGGDKHNRRRRSSSKSSSGSSSTKNGSTVDINKGKEEEGKGKSRWEEEEEAADDQREEENHKGKYSPNAVYLMDDREGEEEELMFEEMVGDEEEGEEEEGKKGEEEEDEEEECRQRKELLEGLGRKRKEKHDGDKKGGSILVGQKKNFLSIRRPKSVVVSSNRSPNIFSPRSPSPSTSRPSSSSATFGYKH